MDIQPNITRTYPNRHQVHAAKVTNFHLREREHMAEVAVGTGSVAMYVAYSHEEQEEP